eukprot:1299266-Lingulodinium_polyedra.AAC.1
MARLPGTAQWACSAVRPRSSPGERWPGPCTQELTWPKGMRPCACHAVEAAAKRGSRAAARQQPEQADQRASDP